MFAQKLFLKKNSVYLPGKNKYLKGEKKRERKRKNKYLR